MSSRQEEKERRRRERQERERAEARKASNRRRLQLVAGGVLAVVAVVAVVAAIVSSSGGSSDGPTKSSASSVPIPAMQISDLDAAAQAAGCTVKTYPSEGRTHLPSDTAVNNGYKTNPPTSGSHRPTPAEDGIYAAGNEPAKENWVHTLEHGRILIQYKKGLPAAKVAQLETLFNEKVKGVEGYHEVLMENNTNMPYEVAAVAWTHLLGCPTMNDKVFDAIRAFSARFVDKGPELKP
jgi:hypothetical protein